MGPKEKEKEFKLDDFIDRHIKENRAQMIDW